MHRASSTHNNSLSWGRLDCAGKYSCVYVCVYVLSAIMSWVYPVPRWGGNTNRQDRLLVPPSLCMDITSQAILHRQTDTQTDVHNNHRPVSDARSLLSTDCLPNSRHGIPSSAVNPSSAAWSHKWNIHMRPISTVIYNIRSVWRLTSPFSTKMAI